MTLFSGPQPVDTPSAVSAYRRWKADSPQAATEYLRRSNSLVEAFLSAGDWPRAQQIVADYSKLAVRLGDAIGVSSRIDPPVPGTRGIWKAVGAGNELGVLFGTTVRSAPGGSEAVDIARDGVVWQ